VTGIVLCGFGFGSFFFGLIATSIVNPNDESSVNNLYPIDVADNVPKMLRYLTVMWAFLSVVGIIMTFPAPSQVEFSNTGTESNETIIL
jgi:hypothetical protein